MGRAAQGDGTAARRVVLLYNPPTATFIEGFVGPFKSAAAGIGAEAIIGPANDMPGLESLVAAEAREPNSGLVVIPDVFTIQHRAEIIAVAARHRVAAVTGPARLPRSAA
jgi:putative tryptophan/tyrosine transport system substrate-binding protein